MQLMSVILLWWSFVLAFIPCELGERISDASIEAANIILQFDWYLFPIEVRKMLPMILTIADIPIAIKCFGSISCTREAFQAVRSVFAFLLENYVVLE